MNKLQKFFHRHKFIVKRRWFKDFGVIRYYSICRCGEFKRAVEAQCRHMLLRPGDVFKKDRWFCECGEAGVSYPLFRATSFRRKNNA